MRRPVSLRGTASFVVATAGALVALLLAAPEIAGAQGIPTAGLPQGGDAHIVGSWLLTVSPTGSPTNNAIVTFMADGTTVQSSFGTNSALALTTAQGAWAQTGDHTYANTIWRLQRDAAGNQNVRRTRFAVTVSPTDDELTGQYITEIVDAEGNVVPA